MKNRWIHRKKLAIKVFGGSVDIGGSKFGGWRVLLKNLCKTYGGGGSNEKSENQRERETEIKRKEGGGL